MSEADLRWYSHLRDEIHALRLKMAAKLSDRRKELQDWPKVSVDDQTWEDIKALALRVVVLKELLNLPPSKENHAS